MKQHESKEPSELTVITKAKDLVKHTMILTSNTDRYPKKYRFTLTDRLQNKVLSIYECLLEANELNLNVPEERRQRQALQTRVLTYTKELLYFIELSVELKLLELKSAEYWSKLVFDIRYMTMAWRKKDNSR